MNSELRLKLTFEGTGDGLEHDRLRVDSFAPALIELQRAYRRIAQDMIRSAQNSSAGRGRFSRLVEEFRWEIDTISHHSPVAVALACPMPPPTYGDSMPLFTAETMDRAADELFSSIDSEARGMLRNKAVRRYLGMLPPSIVRQSYRLEKLSGSTREIELGRLNAAALEAEYPAFIIRYGYVVGVHFPPAASEVRFLPDGGSPFTAASGPTHVEFAIEHRAEPVAGLFVRKGKKTSTIWLKRGPAPFSPVSREKRLAYLGVRWKDTLKALAE
jgi:hypothetical protein